MDNSTDVSALAKQDVDLSQDGTPDIIITCAVLLPLTWIAVILRTYCRAVLTRSFQVDDWFMLIAQFIFTITCAIYFAGTKHGLGKHNLAVKDPDDLVAALMYQSVGTIVYVLDMVFIKLSIGVFLLRLAVWTTYKWILWISLIVFTAWGMGLVIWNIFQCTPVAKQWDFRVEGGFCAPPEAIIASAYALSALTVVSDWLYALMPVPMVWNVKMTRQAKWTVVVILGLGIFASVATLVRLAYLKRLTEPNDYLYSAIDVMVWSIIEPGVAIFASSLATIRPLLRFFRIRGFSTAGRTSASRANTSEFSNGGGYSNDKKSAAGQGTTTTFATARISDMSLDNIDDDSDFRQPDAPAEDANVKLESNGQPPRKRPQSRAGGDTLSEILAMDEDDLEEDEDEVKLESNGQPPRKRPQNRAGGDTLSEILAMDEDDLAEDEVKLESNGQPPRKRPSKGAGGDTLSEILAMDDGFSERDNESVDEASDSEAHDFRPHDLEAQTQTGLGVPKRR